MLLDRRRLNADFPKCKLQVKSSVWVWNLSVKVNLNNRKLFPHNNHSHDLSCCFRWVDMNISIKQHANKKVFADESFKMICELVDWLTEKNHFKRTIHSQITHHCGFWASFKSTQEQFISRENGNYYYFLNVTCHIYFNNRLGHNS